MTPPSPTVLLARRIANRLDETRHPQGGNLEPQWSQALVQRVLGALAEEIVDCLSNGEEVKIGNLGKFRPKVVEGREIMTGNLRKDSIDRVTEVPRKVRIDFEPTSYASEKVSTVLALAEELGGPFG